MTLGRTGLGARRLTSTSTPYFSLFTREREDGGGGGTEDDAGGIEDDTDDGDEDDSDDDDSDDDDEPLKDAGKKALKAERDANRELKRQNRELRAQLAKNGKGGGKEGEGESDEDAEARQQRETERARELAKPMIVRTEARRLLTEAGLIGKPDGLLRMLDLKTVDVDYTDDGDVDDIDGLADQIEDLVEEYPTLFRKKVGGAGRIDGADKGNGREAKKKTASELQAAGILGGRRR